MIHDAASFFLPTVVEMCIRDRDKVPVKYSGLSGTELAISESQERMAVLIEADKFEEVKQLARCV